MLVKIVVCLSCVFIHRALGQSECTDVRGRQIAHGLHYVPGPDTCSLCICDNGHARVCKAVLCSQPQDCRSFRVGSTCCEYICLDDVVKPSDGGEAYVRVVAVATAIALMLTFALIICSAIRQNERRSNHAEDQRSLTSIGYISGSMAYVGGNCETGLAAWKPPNTYVPRGEAPPPYDEVVAQTRLEAIRMNSPAYRSYPTAVEAPRAGDQAHQYANISRPVAQIANPQGCYNAPLLQPAHQTDGRESLNQIYHHIPTNNGGMYGGVRLAGSLGALGGRAAPRPPREPPRPFYSSNVAPLPMHRTIPRISTVIERISLDTPVSFSRADRSMQGEVRRSFHKPSSTDTGRSIPRNLNLASSNVEPHIQIGNVRLLTNGGRPSIGSEEQPAPSEQKPAPTIKTTTSHKMAAKTVKMAKPPETVPLPAQASLPLTADKPSCVCSYDNESTKAEETDDYRSECENCKSAGSSRWVVEEGWAAEQSGTSQTLQRRAAHAPPSRAVATLPPDSRNVKGPPSNWENWFNAIPDTDSESEDF